jgi:hypothetical protein
LARDHRDDLIGEIALAVFSGRIPEADLDAHVRILVRHSFKADHDQWSQIDSLDVPLYEDSSVTLGDTVTRGLWG